MNDSNKKALLFHGGWDGHEPESFSTLLAEKLAAHGIQTDRRDDLKILDEAEALKGYDVIIPFWTMGELSKERTENLLAAVANGTGLAGIHGGMGDAFRGNIDYQWVVGGQFLGHPHVGPYTVTICDPEHEITQALPQKIEYDSEQYYMMIDPDVHPLAETTYELQGRQVRMPVAWVRQWEKGRVFYSALGHVTREYQENTAACELAIRGIRWAANTL
jgi:type 1 glutamine amidotransferase